MKEPADPRKRRPAPPPAPRRTSASPPPKKSSAPSPKSPPAPKKKNNLPLLLGAGGGGVALLLVIVVVVATSGPSAPPPAPPPPPRKAAVRPPPAPPAPRTAEDIEAKMRREMEEQRAKVAAEQAIALEAEKKRRAEEERVRAEEAKAAAEAAEKARTEAEVQTRAASTAYASRRRERKAESTRAYEEAKRAVEEHKKAEADRQKRMTERLRTLRLTVRLKNGMVLENAGVLGITPDELRLAFTFEGAQAEQAFPPDFVDDRSFVQLLHAAFKDLGAEGWYEVGRHLVLRRQWKDAKDAFDRCSQADAGFAARIPDLSRVLNNEAAFKGSARRLGADRMILAYDFSDPAMAQDFVARQPAKLEVADGELRLSGRGSGLYSLKDVEFDGELEVDLQAVVDATGTLALGAFFTPDRKGYLVVLNHAAEGNVLYRLENGALQMLAKRAEKRLAPGAEARVRWTVRHGTLRVWVGEEELLSATDAGLSRGWFILGGGGGTLQVRRLTVEGRVQPAEIQKRFAEAEVLVRRALEAGLGAKPKAGVEDAPLLGEDEFVLAALGPAVRSEFEKRRETFLKAVKERKLQPPHAGIFDPVTQNAPKFAAGWFWRGRARRETRRPHEAREAFAKAVELDPEFAEAHAALAQACLDDRDVAAARAAVEKALAVAPGDGTARALGGFLRFVGGDVKGALAELEVARALDPGDDGILAMQRNVHNVMKGPQHLGAKHVKEFPHFIVMTDMSREKTELYGARLEAAYRHFAEAFKESFKEDPSRPKPRVAIFNTREAYLTYGELTLSGRQEWTLGYFHPLFRELLLFEDVDIDATLHTLYHEAFHHFLSLLVPRPPFWFNEGIAEYMGAIRIEASRKEAKVVEKAKLLGGRLTVLKAGLRFALPFKQIMLETPGQFYSGPVSFKYAQAWSMVHFFYEAAEGRHRPRIEAYFKALHGGKDAQAAFDAGFADADLEAMQKEWQDYVRKLELPKK